MRINGRGTLTGLKTVTGTDRRRPALTDPWLDVKAEAVFASDSYIAARIPVHVDEGDSTGMLPMGALELFERYGDRADGIVCKPSSLSFGDYTIKRPKVDKHADINAVIAKAQDKTPVFEIGLNAEFLAKLASAMGHGTVRLTFTGPREPVIVEGLSGEAIGLLMPIQLADSRLDTAATA